VRAVQQQLATLPTATRTLANPAVAAFALELIERCGGAFQRVWLGSDGADAVEVAIKLARRRTGRLRVLAVAGAFHGKTLGALALTSSPAFRIGVEPLLGQVTHVARTDVDGVEAELDQGDVAALVFEPVQGEGGVRLLEPEVMRDWAAAAHAAGAYVISDEIQCGLRRCGPFSIALAENVQADAVLFAKALGGGVMPLSAMVATDDFHRSLASDPTWHSTTFGGHPLACAAGRAALDAIDAGAVRAGDLAARLERELRSLADRHRGIVAEVRGRGLLWGIELRTPGLAGTVFTELLEQGLLVSPCLSAPETIRLLPPMVTTDDQLDFAMAALGHALDAADRDHGMEVFHRDEGSRGH
jgi:putrescine aminotransferase